MKFLDLKRINLSFEPHLSEAIAEVVERGWYIGGTAVKTFERDFAIYVGAKHCISVGNGLDALTLVMRSWKMMQGWEDGDEVILPANTFVATALAVSKAGLKPVFCEPSADDALIDASKIEEHITERTRIVIPVHLYGQTCNMDAISAIASRHGLKVLEDACQAHGAYYHWSNGEVARAGALADAAAFSFYPGKNLGALGDGGCVITDDDTLADTLRMMANYGQQEKYVHTLKGMNSRLDEIQAAVLRIKLVRLDKDNDRRRQIAEAYQKGISNPLVSTFKPPHHQDSHVYHLFVVRCANRDELKVYLESKGVETLIHYPTPLHLQEAYSEYSSLSLPVAENLQQQILSIPISPVTTDEEVQHVIESINDFVR